MKSISFGLMSFSWTKFTILSLIIIAIIKVATLIFLGDVDFEADSYLHFLEAKIVLENIPNNLVVGLNVWSKPLYTFVHGFWLSFFTNPQLIHSQILNIIFSFLISLLTYKIGSELKLEKKYAYLAAILSSIGFLMFRSSITVLTEPVFTLIFISSLYLWLKDKYWLSGALIGLSVLGRIEALLFVAIWGLFYFFKKGDRNINPFKGGLKNYLYFILIISPTFIWNFIGFLYSGRPLYLFSNGYPTEAGVYGYGLPTNYIEGLLVQESITTVFVLIGFCIALASLQLNSRREIFWKFLKSNWGFISTIILIFTVIQTIIYMFGLFGTAGLMRYFVIIMPLLTLVAAKVVANLLEKTNTTPIAKTLVVLALCAAQLLTTFSILRAGGLYKGLENRPSISSQYRDIWSEPEISAFLKSENILYTNRPELLYYSGRDLNNGVFTLGFDSIPEGTLIVLELDWLKNLSGLTPQDFEERYAYQRVEITGDYDQLVVYRN